MIVSALAGCASGDPDGDGELGIDPDLLDELIESNLQDFINNTTVTVNQEIHYHNNTTYVIDDSTYQDITNNNFNNTTNVDEGDVNNNYDEESETIYNIGGNGNYSGSSNIIYFVIHKTMNLSEFAPELDPSFDVRLQSFEYNKTYQAYVWVDTGNGSGYYDYRYLSYIHIIHIFLFHQLIIEKN